LADEDELVPYVSHSVVCFCFTLLYFTLLLCTQAGVDDSRYKIGDAFFQLPLADAQSLLASSTEQIDSEVSKLEETLGDVREELQQLKVALYARFGRSINLET
jgi:hypothetical protein